jgi:tRNA modification GTPase
MSRLRELRDPDSGEIIDQAVVTVYEAPDSYTGEDLVEISCHGGWLVPALTLDACLRAGARRAEAGEFTRRAFLHGKMDLVQVEAVADLIEARSRAHHRAAVTQLDRGLSARVGRLREGLVRLEAMLVHHIDFPEEDDAPVPLEGIAEEAVRLHGEMVAMLRTAPEGALLREGALTVLAGRPNVGKSSLYNALLGEERAIVTDIPGTTTDALEAAVEMGGYPFRLVDTAGMREEGGDIERLGIEVAKRFLARADLVLLCVEAGRGLDREEWAFMEGLGTVPCVLVETKADRVAGSREAGAGGFAGEGDAAMDGGLAVAGDGAGEGGGAVDEGRGGDGRGGGHRDWSRAEGRAGAVPAGHVRVSVETGEGLGELRALLPELVFSGLVQSGGEAPVLTRRRQADGLATAAGEMEAFQGAVSSGVPAELAATHLRAAGSALEEVLGVIPLDDVLDAVFRDFCVGK